MSDCLPRDVASRFTPTGLETLITRRLVGTRLQIEDFADWWEFYQDPRVMAWLSGDGRLLSAEQTYPRFQAALDHWKTEGYGIWMFRDPITSSFVGRAGLKQGEFEGRMEVELLYTVLPPFWRQGYATEMSRAVLAVAFQSLQFSTLIAFTLVNNLASQGVMKKLGFQYERAGIHADLPHVFYRLHREEKTPCRRSFD